MILKTNTQNFVGINHETFDMPIMAYYIAEYNEFPSMYHWTAFYDIDKIYDFVFEKYKVDQKSIVGFRVRAENGKVYFEDMVCKLKDKILLRIFNKTGISPAKIDDNAYYHMSSTDIELPSNCKELSFCITYNHEEVPFQEILDLEKEVSKFSQTPRKKGLINIVTNQPGVGFRLKEFEIKSNKDLDIELNYGEEFVETHEIIFEKLSSKEYTKGLVLLYGDPGTGKTSYIRYLINSIANKKVIYLTPDLAIQMSDPSFMSFLMNHPNSILVIEDGETILKTRKSGNNQSVANLLNVADGLLGDVLDIQIVCTFNCDIGDVDSALLRKGRLIAKHHFGKLSIEDAQKLSDSLNFSTEIKEPMVLADIYNQNDKDFKDKESSIGFGKG